jgi:hypothetical protein
LVEQKERLDKELKAMTSSLESREHVIQEMRARLEAEVRHRDLQIKLLQTQARSNEVTWIFSDSAV